MIVNATWHKVRQCPWWRCGKHVGTDHFLAHVQGHSVEGIFASALDGLFDGLTVSAQSTRHPVRPELARVSIDVKCPVCGAFNDDFPPFAEHLWACHLVDASIGDTDLFLIWKTKLESVCTRFVHKAIRSLAPWRRLQLSHYWFQKDLRQVDCPSCTFSVHKAGRYWSHAEQDMIASHHLSFLRPEADVIAELYPHRFQTFRLYPDFVTHPIFADFDTPAQVNEIRLSSGGLPESISTPEQGF